MFSHSTAEWTAAFYLVEHVITPDSSAAALNAVSSVIPWAFLGVMNSIVIFHLLHPAEICYNIPHVAFSPQVDMHESPVCPLTGVAAPNDDLCRPMATHSPVTGPSTTVSMVTSSAARQIQPHYSPALSLDDAALRSFTTTTDMQRFQCFGATLCDRRHNQHRPRRQEYKEPPGALVGGVE